MALPLPFEVARNAQSKKCQEGCHARSRERMKKLVLHVGAGKCGSTSIQRALLRPMVQQAAGISYVELDPKLVSGLVDPDLQTREAMRRALDAQFARNDSELVVFSHEVMGKLPAAVNAISRRARTQGGINEVVVVGFTRRQSSYVVAAFKQWHFRNPKRLAADIEVLTRLELDPGLFSPLERHVIAIACRTPEDRPQTYVPDWNHYYQMLMNKAAESDGAVRVESNHIPTKQESYPLFADFASRAGIECPPDVLDEVDKPANAAFSDALCEAVAEHLSDRDLDSSWIPGPHDDNPWFNTVSLQFDEAVAKPDPPSPESVLQNAAALIDHRFRDSNMAYCSLMDVEEGYFGVTERSDISAESLLEVVWQAHGARNLNDVLERRRQLIGALEEFHL